MSKIIIIEDDLYLREELVNTFVKKGYSVSSISSFDAPEQEILNYNPDLIILDINLPGKSGFELCRGLKSRAFSPILILTARDTLADELYALGLGADDFLTKPCHPDRLLARVERLLHTYDKMKHLVQAEHLILDLDTYKVIWKKDHMVLSDTEGRILQLLIEKYPDVVSKSTFYHLIWGGEAYIDENILQVNMTRLRKNLSAIGLGDIILTVRGQGYRLEVNAS